MSDNNLANTYMKQAIKLAKKGVGLTDPNPCVGALVVKNNKIIGQGAHLKSGCEHAEVIAIKEAGEEARDADLFITLEPCAHQGKTPPCTDLILRAGIKCVYIAIEDPNPLVSGKGIKVLKKHNIKVVVGFFEKEVREINRGFFFRMNYSRPFIYSKIAASIDGKTSLKNGDSKWITSESSRKDVQNFRAKSSAIMTGVGTINNDNPSLTVRSRSSLIQPRRIILDSHLSINQKANILNQENVYIFFGDDPNNQLPGLKKSRANFIQLDLIDNQVNIHSLMKHLNKLEINNLLVEAGPKLNGALLELSLIDELIIYSAPIILGGNARPMFNSPELKKMDAKINFLLSDTRVFGSDTRTIFRAVRDDLD